jgi:hypothetical protein
MHPKTDPIRCLFASRLIDFKPDFDRRILHGNIAANKPAEFDTSIWAKGAFKLMGDFLSNAWFNWGFSGAN